MSRSRGARFPQVVDACTALHVHIPLVPPTEADPLEIRSFGFPHAHGVRAFGARVLKTKEEADGWDAERVCV